MSGGHGFIHESLQSSVDYPAYIPWVSLSTEVSRNLNRGSIRINRSNQVEYTKIDEEAERCEKVPLLQDEGTNFVPETQQQRSGSSISWGVAAFLLVNSALGAGVLNVPAAFAKTGGMFLITMIQFGMMALLSSTMLILAYCSDLSGCNSYHEVLKQMCGRTAQLFAAGSIMMTCYGICITFLIIIGDQFDRIFASQVGEGFCDTMFLSREFTISATAIIFISPMIFKARIDFLKYASTFGIFAMLYPVLLTVYEYFLIGAQEVEFNTKGTSIMDLMTVIPMISFAYQTHEVVVPVYASMANRNVIDFAKSTAVAMAFLFFAYTITGAFGYWTFGMSVPQDIMQKYDAKDPIVLIGVLALVIKMITTYPPILVCGRGAVDGLITELLKMKLDKIISTEVFRRRIITFFWFWSTLALAIFTPNIGVAIEMLGCLAFCNVFIFPAGCLISLIREKKRKHEWGYLKRGVLKTWAYFILLFGVIVFCVVAYQVVANDLIGGEAKPHDLCHPNKEGTNITMSANITMTISD